MTEKEVVGSTLITKPQTCKHVVINSVTDLRDLYNESYKTLKKGKDSNIFLDC